MTKLPCIQHPVFDVVIPSSKKKTKIRPMKVKEEKILLMAKVSENPYDIYNSIRQVINNCLVSGDVDVDKLALFDMEYLFLKIRAISISNIIHVTYTDVDDKKEYPFAVDLDKIEVKFPEDAKMRVEIGPDEGFQMRYPVAELYSSPAFNDPATSDVDLVEELIISCLETYFAGEKVYKMAENKPEEIKEFVENLDIATYNKMREFVSNLPSIYYEIKYKNSLGAEKVIKMTTLSDFFTLV